MKRPDRPRQRAIRRALEARLVLAARRLQGVVCCRRCQHELEGYIAGLADAAAIIDGRAPSGVLPEEE